MEECGHDENLCGLDLKKIRSAGRTVCGETGSGRQAFKERFMRNLMACYPMDFIEERSPVIIKEYKERLEAT